MSLDNLAKSAAIKVGYLNYAYYLYEMKNETKQQQKKKRLQLTTKQFEAAIHVYGK